MVGGGLRTVELVRISRAKADALAAVAHDGIAPPDLDEDLRRDHEVVLTAVQRLRGVIAFCAKGVSR